MRLVVCLLVRSYYYDFWNDVFSEYIFLQFCCKLWISLMSPRSTRDCSRSAHTLRSLESFCLSLVVPDSDLRSDLSILRLTLSPHISNRNIDFYITMFIYQCSVYPIDAYALASKLCKGTQNATLRRLRENRMCPKSMNALMNSLVHPRAHILNLVECSTVSTSWKEAIKKTNDNSLTFHIAYTSFATSYYVNIFVYYTSLALG